MDIHGNSVGKTNLRPGVPITEMVWNCERFNMEEPLEPAPVMNNIFPSNVHPPKDPKPYQRSNGKLNPLNHIIIPTDTRSLHIDFVIISYYIHIYSI